MGSRTIFCSGADRAFFPLLQGMVSSIRDHAQGSDVVLGILDLGLEGDQITWLRGAGCQVITPGWDVDFPLQAESPRWLQAMVARPFLPRHFPGFDVYGWIDSDVWVQQLDALLSYQAVAEQMPGHVAISLEIDRAYACHFVDETNPDKQRHRLAYSIFYGEGIGHRLAALPIANVGVMAAHRDCPIWPLWQQEVAANLQK